MPPRPDGAPNRAPAAYAAMSEIEERLQELERLGLDRRLRLVSGPQGPTVLLDGRPVLLLCSNNYLGLADHPRVREAAAEAAMRWGVGAGASRLVSGTMTIHRRLEERLAAFERSEACLLFGSGYLANMGVIDALAGPGDTVFSDELNHASIIDGCRLSRAEVVVYRHADIEHLNWSLRRHGGRRDGRGGRLIVTDSVFSMDGEVAPLTEIVELANCYGARMVVDEAHATGALGPDGRGAIAEAGLEGEVDVVVGTLGKALGSYGAYVCADAEMVRYLINTARPLIFSTAPPPPAVAGALAALELLRERPHRVQRLRSNARALRGALAEEGFPVADGRDAHRPADRGRGARGDAPLPGGDRAGRVRPGDPPADGAGRNLPPAPDRRWPRTPPPSCETAARVLGEVARAMGLDPAAIGPPSSSAARRLEPAIPDDEEPMPDAEPFIPAAPPADSRTWNARPPPPSSTPGASAWQQPCERDVRVPFDAEHAAGRRRTRRRTVWTGRTPRSTSSARPPSPARPSSTPPAALVRGLFITGTDTGAGKTILSAALLAAMADEGEPVRALQARRHGPRGPGGDRGARALATRPRAARRSRGDGPRGGLAAALRPGRIPPPRRQLAGEPHRPRPAARGAGARGRRRRRRSSSRASAGCSRRSRRTTRCATSRSRSNCPCSSPPVPGWARSTTRC